LLGLFRWMTAVVVLCPLVPSTIEAQYPRARRGQFEVQGLDFRRNGGWRSRVSAVRTARHRLLRARAFGTLNQAAVIAGANRVTGRVIVPVVPIAFRNVAPPFPGLSYEALFFSSAPVGRPYSLRTFYEQISNGNVTIGGRVFGWVVADSSDTYYEDGCNGIGVLAPCPPRAVSRFGTLLLRTLDQVSNGLTASSVWSHFDNDGPDGRPNSGDDDGFVDFVTFLQPERDGACADSPNIWAHRFVIRAWNGGSPYVTRTPWTGHPGQFLKVDDYIIQSAVGGSSACDPTELMPIGTLAHETGHVFGLPDLYDTDLSNPQATQGIGEWGLMGSGNYARPYSPSRLEAWSLFELGWVTVDTLSSGREVHLGPVASSDTVLYLPVPNSDEFYLLENRQAQETDSAQMNPGFGPRQKAPGLLVWHVDQGQVEAHGFATDNRVNVGPIHGVALVQADGREDLRSPGSKNRGDTGDSYPGATGNTSLCRTTSPPASDNQGGFAWFCMDGIRQLAPVGPVAFRYVAYRSVFSTDRPGALIGVNGSLVSRLEQFFSPGTEIQLFADSVQADPSGRTRFEFLTWSDGGPRSHSLIARDLPDTVVAQMTAQHRLRMAVQGATVAAVASGLTGDIAAGVFLTEGTRVALRAAPQPGAVFAGWSGDTTAVRDTLTLPMLRPFDVTANYLTIREVPLATAADVLFGKGALVTEQSTYLDVVGNRNGVFDLGDFLSAVDRLGSGGADPATAPVLALREPGRGDR
jgi:M6 family metalloprotease-like protein